MRRRARPIAVAGILVVGLWAIAGPALAQYSGGLEASISSGAPGSLLELSGTGYKARTTVTITFESTPVVLARTTTNAAGSFAVRVRIPSNATPGVHTLRATGTARGGGVRVLSFTFTVTGSGLARTGRDLLLSSVLAVGLAALGIGLIRTRRSS